MEVKVKELHVFLKVAFVNLTDVFLSDTHFSGGFVPQKVDYVNWAIGLNNIVHVDSEGFLCHLGVARDCNIFKNALLFPENRDRAAHLDVAKEKLVVDQQDLFGFTLVADVALIVDSTRVVSSASAVVDSA